MALTLSLGALALVPAPLAAQEHLVSPRELHQQIASHQQTRLENLRDVDRLLGSEPVQASLQSAGLDAKQIRDAVSLLDDAEMARLADRARAIDADLQAGALSNEHLTYIVIALASAIIVLIAT